jgi:hypothetical protein
LIELAEVRDLRARRVVGWASFPAVTRLRDEFTMAGWRWRIAGICWSQNGRVLEVVARRRGPVREEQQ